MVDGSVRVVIEISGRFPVVYLDELFKKVKDLTPLDGRIRVTVDDHDE